MGAIMSSGMITCSTAQLAITSFYNNGDLSWNDPAGEGSDYAVQWKGSLEDEWKNWKQADESLTGLGPAGTVKVPMFYRMVAHDPDYRATERYSYFDHLPTFDPRTPLATNEMRITFMGSMIPLPVRLAQAEMSIFVEVGWVPNENDQFYHGKPVDQFVFDLGAGASANYAAAYVGYRRMDKIFINHLHADHMNDLMHTYCFGPSSDRKSPLYVWGSDNTGIESPAGSNIYYDDGVEAFCAHLREAARWHTESFSFQTTAYESYIPPTRESWGLPHDPVPVGDDDPKDAYAMVPIKLDWSKIGGVAYSNADTRAVVTHFPVIHCRKGSMGYKLEWKTPEGSILSMIYTSDTKPETNCVTQAINNNNGVDVFIHEMVVPPSVWAYMSMGLDDPPDQNDPRYAEFQATTQALTYVQNSSHTSQGAFGYLLSQINPKPRLSVATHFPTSDKTVASAVNSITNRCPEIIFGENFACSFYLMVLRVFPDRIEQCRAAASRFSNCPPVRIPQDTLTPKYHDVQGKSDPYAQIDISSQIPARNPDNSINYREDGF